MESQIQTMYDAQASECCDLLPCPFCGGEAGFDYYDGSQWWDHKERPPTDITISC